MGLRPLVGSTGTDRFGTVPASFEILDPVYGKERRLRVAVGVRRSVEIYDGLSAQFRVNRVRPRSNNGSGTAVGFADLSLGLDGNRPSIRFDGRPSIEP